MKINLIRAPHIDFQMHFPPLRVQTSTVWMGAAKKKRNEKKTVTTSCTGPGLGAINMFLSKRKRKYRKYMKLNN